MQIPRITRMRGRMCGSVFHGCLQKTLMCRAQYDGSLRSLAVIATALTSGLGLRR